MLASTTQPQEGASRMIAGTGSAKRQPETRKHIRPKCSENRPAKREAMALTRPKVTMKERMAARDASPKSRSATSGSNTRSMPTEAPTKAFTRIRSANCSQLARRPRRIALAPGCTVWLGNRTAICSRFEFCDVAFRHRPCLVQLHNAKEIQRSGRDTIENGSQKIVLAAKPLGDVC